MIPHSPRCLRRLGSAPSIPFWHLDKKNSQKIIVFRWQPVFLLLSVCQCRCFVGKHVTLQPYSVHCWSIFTVIDHEAAGTRAITKHSTPSMFDVCRRTKPRDAYQQQSATRSVCQISNLARVYFVVAANRTNAVTFNIGLPSLTFTRGFLDVGR